MNNLLKEAIADAKAVRETALANAKLALEEAFTPRLQSMLSARLSEEEEGYEEEIPVEEDETPLDAAPEMEAPVEEDEEIGALEPEMEEGEEVEAPLEAPVEAPVDAPVEEEEDLELEAILRELEEEGDFEEAPVEEGEEIEDESPVVEEGEEEEVDLEEIINALREEEGDDANAAEPDNGSALEEGEDGEEVEAELEEAYKVIRFMKSKLNEVNLLNAKLLFSNKLFRNHSLNETQKMTVIENFDRAQTLREVKLVFATLAESFKMKNGKQLKTIKESYASKASRSTRPTRKVLSEGSAVANRFKKLAGLL